MSDDEAFLELESEAPAAPPPADPTPHLPAAAEDEAFLEVEEVARAPLARAVRVVSDDDLRVVTALAEDDRPLLDALHPAEPDLAARPPTAAALAERLAFVRAVLNQVTRRGAEWRARAEVAGAALARRLAALQGRGELATVALAELTAWHDRALEALVTREAGAARALYPAEIARLDAEALRRGLAVDHARALAARLGVGLHTDALPTWSTCDALPGSPRTLDEAAAALTTHVAHAVVALREGALSAWLKANRAEPSLVAVADAAEATARRPDADAAVVAAWTLAWAMGREGVVLDGLLVTSPEVLRTHLRAGRLDASRVRSQARALAEWFRRGGHGAVAAACEALGRDEAHGAQRLSWSLGEPLRLASQPVADPTALAREVLRRPEARAEALERWRDGTLAAWMDALPRAKRDAAWAEDLAAPRAHDADEGSFWRSLYRRVPRAPLRVFVEVGAATRAVRFEGLGDLRSTARVAAAWGALRDAHVRGELHAWLGVAAPGVELDAPPPAADEPSLSRALWSLGATGLVLGRGGGAGVAVDTPADVVLAWRRSPLALEAALAQGVLGEWLGRFHPREGVAGLDLADAFARWGSSLGAGVAPSGVAALRCALLCGLPAIPKDPTASGGPDGRTLVGFVGIDPSERDEAAWSELLDAPGDPLAQGTALLWATRHAPSLGVLAGVGVAREAVREALLATGRPVPSAPLAETLAEESARAERRARQREMVEEGEKLAAKREAARAQLAQEEARAEAEREAARSQAAREALRREVDREIARIQAEREAARRTHDGALAQMKVERALAEAEHARALAEMALAKERAPADAAEVVDPAELETRWRAAARQAAEEEARGALARSEAELREAALRAAEQAAAEEVRRAAERVAAERSRRERARVELTATLSDLVAREEALRADAVRAAEEATRLALSLAAGETERAEAERAAEEAARAAAEARDARLAAEWTATRARAEAEIEALSQAERARREEARRVGAEGTASRAPASDEPAVDEGFTEDPTAEAADDGLAEELLSRDRHEVVADRLAVAYEGVDDAALAGLRDAVDAWSRARRGHPLAALGAAMTVDAVTMVPAFEAHVATRLESRVVERRGAGEGSDEDAVPVAAEALGEGDDAVDPWLLDLAPVDTWDRLTVDAPLALRPRRGPCPRCADGPRPGHLRCPSCDAVGTLVCSRCSGYGRARCGRCGGNGEVLAPGGGSRRCPQCEGRGDVSCGGCSLGRVACRACEGAGQTPCPTCGASGEAETRPWVVQSVLGVRARAAVAVGLPDAIAAEVGVPGSEAAAVVHVEADAIDPAALARELPHDHLGAALADLLAAETARAASGQRVTRQQVVVWRYPAWRLSVRVAGEPYTLWVHGARRQVWAERSPLDAATEAAVAAVRALVAGDSFDAAIDRLVALASEDPGHPGARDAATELGDAVLAMAERGELYEAQRLAERGAVVRWPDAVSRLVQAERVAGRRLNKRASWALVEDARAAMQRGLDGRAIDLLKELHAAAPDDADGAAMAEELGRRFEAQAAAMIARGAEADAALLLARAEGAGFPGVRAAMAGSAAALKRAGDRARWRTAAAVAAAVAVLAAVARALAG